MRNHNNDPLIQKLNVALQHMHGRDSSFIETIRTALVAMRTLITHGSPLFISTESKLIPQFRQELETLPLKEIETVVGCVLVYYYNKKATDLFKELLQPTLVSYFNLTCNSQDSKTVETHLLQCNEAHQLRLAFEANYRTENTASTPLQQL